MSTAFKSQNTLRQQLVHVKISPPEEKKSNVMCISDSVVYSHLQTTGHTFSTKEVVILDRESKCIDYGVKESILERVETSFLFEHRWWQSTNGRLC